MKLIEPLAPPGRYDSADPFGNIGGRQYPHTGSDWNGVPAGTAAKAIGTGVVVNKQWHAGNGNTVTVKLPDGHYYAYLHLIAEAPVAVGATVTIGQVIGNVGDTGYNSRGPHLHVTVSDSPTAYAGGGNLIDPWRFIQDHLSDTDPTTPEDDMYDSAAESRLMAKLDSMLSGIRREARGRLYFDAGNAGTLTEAQATRFVIAKVTDGFIYPLNPDPAARAGQLVSLRATPYQIIDAAEVAVGLDSHKFNNLIEQANGHLRRIGAEVLRQQNGGVTPAVTPTTVLGAASATPVLVPPQP